MDDSGAKEGPSQGQKLVKFWLKEIDRYEKAFKRWNDYADKIVKRYRNEGKVSEFDWGSSATRYNILWSNIQTLQPAIYSRLPKPQIERRFKDNDPVGRIASETLERATEECIAAYDLDTVFKSVRDDYLLSGRGQVWIRYVPHYAEQGGDEAPSQSTQVGSVPDTVNNNEAAESPAEEQAEGEAPTGETEALLPEVVYEEVLCDYLQRKDFGHTPARTWPEVRACWRKAYMTRDELVKRFGAKGQDCELNLAPEDDEDDDDDTPDEQEAYKKALVYEIYDKVSRKAFWICKGSPDEPLDVKDDPLGLKDFFPCPRPLFATLTTDKLIPVPDYAEYKAQAEELDDLSGRIEELEDALKVAGVYDAGCEELKNLLNAGIETKLIPVKNWPQLQSNGGIEGAVQFMPIEMIAGVLLRLYEARDKLIKIIYDTTGMSDIIRGSSNPYETAEAQGIKAQFATLRLKDRQAEMQRFIRDVVRIKAEIIAEHFDPKTLGMMTGLDFRNQLDVQNFQAASQLLKSDTMRSFRVDIETDSVLAADEQADKQSATEFIQATTQFLQTAQQIGEQNPAAIPLLGELFKFGVSRYRAGRTVEAAIDQFIDQMQQAAAQGQGGQPQPDPKLLQVQSQAQIAQARLAMDQQKQASDTQLQQQKEASHAAIMSRKVEGNIAIQQQRTEGELAAKAADASLKERALELKASMGSA